MLRTEGIQKQIKSHRKSISLKKVTKPFLRLRDTMRASPYKWEKTWNSGDWWTFPGAGGLPKLIWGSTHKSEVELFGAHGSCYIVQSLLSLPQIFLRLHWLTSLPLHCITCQIKCVICHSPRALMRFYLADFLKRSFQSLALPSSALHTYPSPLAVYLTNLSFEPLLNIKKNKSRSIYS